jgi:hypothetical protein
VSGLLDHFRFTLISGHHKEKGATGQSLVVFAVELKRLGRSEAPTDSPATAHMKCHPVKKGI